MSYRGRWTEPTDRTARDEYRALRRELKSSRTAKARQLEIETRLDEFAAVAPKPKEPSRPLPPPLQSVPAAETVRPVPSVSDRERARSRAENGTAQEKAEAVLSELPEHPLRKLARELEQYIWNEDRSNPKPSVTALTEQRVRHWLSRAPYNLHDIRGSKKTVANAVAEVYRLVAERDAAEPGWFVRRAERLLDAPPTLPVIPTQPSENEDPVEPTPIPVNTEPEPALNPVIRAAADLAARAALVLQTDSWLSRLSEHSPDMRTKILASLSDELLRKGFVSGDFCAQLYNDSRPRAVSAFPPRQF